MHEQPTPHHQQETAGQADLYEIRALLDHDSNYADLFENMYKYADEVHIEGSEGRNAGELFAQVALGNQVIGLALDAASHLDSGEQFDSEPVRYSLEHLRDSGRSFCTRANGLEVEKLTSMFDWALRSWTVLGPRYGRPCTVDEAEIPGLVETTRLMLTRVKSAMVQLGV